MFSGRGESFPQLSQTMVRVSSDEPQDGHFFKDVED
jgi:hypothetical protein